MYILKSLTSRIKEEVFGRSREKTADHIDNVGNRHVFVHIPKNAGSSVAEALDMPMSWHYTAQAYRERLGTAAYKRRFSFAFVRNPWDRFLSLYRYARLDESRYHSAIDPEDAPYGKHDDYDLLQDASPEECAQYLQEGRLEHDDLINHWRPQSDWLTDDSGEIIVDFIGRVESIEEDFQIVADRVALAVDTLPMTNPSTSSKDSEKDYRSSFTEEARRIVTEYYQEDICRFGYEF